MALPAYQLSPTRVIGDFLSPDDRLRSSLLVDYEMGGLAIGDPSRGLRLQPWEARVWAGMIQTRPEAGGSWYDITSDVDITEIALAFDQNMRPSVSYVAGGVAKFYWYDAFTAAFATTTLTGASSPVVTMDDKREMQVGLNDVLLFYLKAGRVMHRVQRDRYLIEYDLAPIPTGTTRILQWGMSNINRIQLAFR